MAMKSILDLIYKVFSSNATLAEVSTITLLGVGVPTSAIEARDLKLHVHLWYFILLGGKLS